MSVDIPMDQHPIQTPPSIDEVLLPDPIQLADEPPTQGLQERPSNNNPTPRSEQQRDITIAVDARFGPSCAPVLSQAQIVYSIIEASLRLDRQRWLYLFIGCVPTLVIMCVLWIAWAVMSDSPTSAGTISRVDIFHAAIAFGSLTGLILLWALYYGARNYWNRDRYALLESNVRYLIKLEGDPWIRYVEYLYGPDRTGFWYFGAIGAMTFHCCRKSHYQELITRGYGHIVFCEQGFILDEMSFVVRNKTHIVLAVSYVTNMGLRVYLLRKHATYTVHKSASEAERQQAAQEALQQKMVPLDIYLPNIPRDLAVLLGLQIRYGL